MYQKTFPLWISHSSLGDFLTCHRAYYLKQIYKDPNTGKKINIINPALALGQAVHEALEPLAKIKAEDRFKVDLLERFGEIWKNFAGESGGFKNAAEEELYKERGMGMLKRVLANPGPLVNKALRFTSKDSLPPRYHISPPEEEDIILCGKVDWLEYFPEDDSVHIIDFKTGVHEEKSQSLQLPIYVLLVNNCQKRKINKVSYWYLDKDDEPTEVPMPGIKEAHERVMEVALKVKELRKNGNYVCFRDGCFACRPLENIIKGKAKFVKNVGYQDIYINI